MKRTLVLLLLLISSNIYSQSKEDTIDYLIYSIQENQHWSDLRTKLKFFKADKESKGDRLLYMIETLDSNGEIINSKLTTLYIDEIKNIILTEKFYDGLKKYHLRIGIDDCRQCESFAYVMKKFSGSYVEENSTELIILLPGNFELADKIKNAFIHLGELYDIKIKDLDMF